MNVQLAYSISNFSHDLFSEWNNLCWSMRIAYLLWESNEIAPCMFGEFSYNGKQWECDASGIRKLAAADTILVE